jgi:hypothetical protein
MQAYRDALIASRLGTVAGTAGTSSSSSSGGSTAPGTPSSAAAAKALSLAQSISTGRGALSETAKRTAANAADAWVSHSSLYCCGTRRSEIPVCVEVYTARYLLSRSMLLL